MSRLLRGCLLALLLVYSLVVNAAIYRNVDKNGVVTYSDTPSGNDSTEVEVDSELSSSQKEYADKLRQQEEAMLEQNAKNAKQREKIEKTLAKINASLDKLEKKKASALSQERKCMSRNRVVIMNPSACKKPGVDYDACILKQRTTQYPTTKKTCTPSYYSKLIELIDKRQKLKQQLMEQLEKLPSN